MQQTPKCPFGRDFICVEGLRYKQTPTDAIAKPLPQDLPGLLFVGQCFCCEKVQVPDVRG